MSNSNDSTLYILGNGFDCCHKLNTETKDFLQILESKEIYNETETARTVFERYGILWGNYESDLADIDLQLIADEQIIEPDYLSDHEYDRDGGIHNMQQYTKSLHNAVQESLKEMVSKANDQLEFTNPKFINFLKAGDAVISFNYTSTLEKMYDIPSNVQICHIHGFYEKGDKLLFGFQKGISEEEYNNKYFDTDAIEIVQKKINEIQNNENLSKDEKNNELLYWNAYYENLIGDRDYYMDEQLKTVFDFYQSLKKEIQLEKLSDFLDLCKKIKRIVVIGHSMNFVDGDYMELIDKKICPIEWKISQYENSPSRNDIKNYSFANKICFFNLNDVYLIK